MSDLVDVKLQRALRFKTFMDRVPNVQHPQCHGIYWVLSYIYNYIDEPIEAPTLARNLEGWARLSWLVKDAYLAISVKKDGSYAWFYKDNLFKANSELSSIEDEEGFLQLTASLGRLAERYEPDFKPPTPPRTL